MPFLGEKWGIDLTFTAKQYQIRGWSVIPLLGSLDSERAKHPAIKWGRYQHTHPLQADFHDWFIEQGFGGLGIVCGRISKLVVLDFDDAALVSGFRHQYPDLIDTYTVQSGTRHLPHYYYQLPDGLDAHSRSVAGVDFRADGAYVVAPPTQVGDAVWQVVEDAPLRILSKDDLKAIWRFLASIAPSGSHNRSGGLSGSNPGHSVFTSSPIRKEVSSFQKPLSVSSSSPSSDESGDELPTLDVERCLDSDTWETGLLSLYASRLVNGRNNALFQTACMARNQGLGKEVIIQALASVHASQPSPDGSQEIFRVRHDEALRTIDSVFKRQPIPHAHHTCSGVGIPTPSQSQSSTTGLHNSIREWLVAHHSAAAARVIDGLLLAGVQAGSDFTERQACVWLRQYRIGRRSIMTALKSLLPDGALLFEKVVDPLRTSPIPASAAIDPEKGLNKCDLVTGANRVKTSGRPATYYRLPDNHTLAERLGLTLSQADSIAADDLASPQTYRRAMHRELVKRRPGSYSRRWLSKRLGVSKWTSRRYDAALKVVIHPTYIEQPVRWTNVESLVPRTIEDAPPGTFLETEDGKRYPPLRSIAMHLLDTGHKVVHKTRAANHYSFPNTVGVGIQTPTIQLQASAPLRQASLQNDSYSHSTALTFNQPKEISSSNQQDMPLSPNGVWIPTPSNSETQHSFWLCPSCLKTHIATDPPKTCARCGSSDWERVPDIIWRDQERLKLYWQSRWREKHPAAPRHATPLVTRSRCRNPDTLQYSDLCPDSENDRAAQRAHKRVPGLSRINALRLVERYGIAKVENAITRVEHRNSVRNPAGFLVALLRSEHSFYSRELNETKQRPVAEAAEWVRRMTESAFVNFLSNADEFTDRAKSK